MGVFNSLFGGKEPKEEKISFLKWIPLTSIEQLDEIKEQDYSLTPGRYVGVKIDIDMDFDYKGRMQEIHTELAQLNTEANSLMDQIQSVKL